ncbi:MAG TPA: cytochrome ubiquinol oxidase subunit I [Hyphomicrobiales bacterium]|nr:cytochrome ubiquinol oxidase subunit I [Hyphomicrobiales bacterium]
MFEGLDAVFLARIQFAFTITFHIVFPALTIGLASYLVVLESFWLATGRQAYRQVYDYWLRIFAIAFGMGVVSGVVMSYHFGTNWSVFSDKTGPVLGPLMSYEVLTAFFLEAGFLGVMLFGRERVGRGIYFFSTAMVAAGSLVSAFWILSANSWMHTPAGYAVNEAGQFVPEDWWAIIFNPSFPYRFLHMTVAAYLATAFLVGAVGAYHLLRRRQDEAARLMFSMAMWMAALVTPVQVVIGDLHGLNTLEHQPRKVAAMEGHFKALQQGAPVYLFGWPSAEERRLKYAVGIPKLGSLILVHELDGVVRGLEAWPREEWPPLPIVFWSFRVMVGLGLVMMLVGLVSLWLRWRGALYQKGWFLRLSTVMAPTGFVAIVAGWFTTEIGRQPYVVYGLLRTAEAASPVGAPAVAGSLTGIIVVYVLVFGAGVFYLLRLMAASPAEVTSEQAEKRTVAAKPAAGETPS